jgi:hypothetical protein
VRRFHQVAQPLVDSLVQLRRAGSLRRRLLRRVVGRAAVEHIGLDRPLDRRRRFARCRDQAVACLGRPLEEQLAALDLVGRVAEELIRVRAHGDLTVALGYLPARHWRPDAQHAARVLEREARLEEQVASDEQHDPPRQ